MYMSKPKTLLLLLFLLCFTFSYAQREKESLYINHNFTLNKTFALYGDTVKLRSEPNTTSEVVTILRIGDEVTILKKTDQLLETSTAKTAWYEVNYNGKKGFIAGQFIANAHKQNGNQHFYFRKFINEEQGVLHIRTLFNTSTKAYTETTVQLMDESIGISFEKPHDLKNVIQIVEVNYFGDSCGAESGYSVLFLKDDYTLVKVADLSLIGDGGIYYLSEKFLYTTDEDNGQPIIQFIKEEGELVDGEKDWFESKKMTRKYEWNGKKLVPEFSKEFKKRDTSN